MRRSASRLCVAAILLLGAATPAAAHPGHDQGAGLLAGFLHPFTGYDHLAAMLLVGLWAARLPRRQVLLLPAAFMGAMAVGFLLGRAGPALPAETLVLLSLPVLAIGALGGVRLPAALAGSVVALFALGHGYAHAAEATGGEAGFAAGMLGATALLHALGLIVGIAVARIGGSDARVRREDRQTAV